MSIAKWKKSKKKINEMMLLWTTGSGSVLIAHEFPGFSDYVESPNTSTIDIPPFMKLPKIQTTD